MTRLYIDRRGAELDYEPDRLVLRADGERRATVPLGGLEQVVLRGTARLTTRLLNALWRRGIGLFLLAGPCESLGARLAGRTPGNLRLRLAQYALLGDEPARAAFARELVAAKIRGQRRLLGRARPASRKPREIDRALEILDGILAGLADGTPDRARLRGLEGGAARTHYRAYATLFAPALAFSGRNRRPPRDPVNVLLSLGYTMLHRDALREIELAGLDPLLGIYHELAPGRESLACDLVEPLRPAVDRWVWRLFADRVLRPEHFSARGRGCRLGKKARIEVYRSYETAARPWRRLLARSAGLLARELSARADPGLLPEVKEMPERDR